MLKQFQLTQQSYPKQFWLLFWGLLISTIGSSMIWPFTMIYVSETLDLPLINVTSLMAVSALMRVTGSFIAGPLSDRLGRKWMMVISLSCTGLAYIAMNYSTSLGAFAVCMGLNGLMVPLYRVGADAMLADVVPPHQRADAYALFRMSDNAGIAIGPALGGFVVAGLSYSVTFFIAAAGLNFYSLLIAFFAAETLPAQNRQHPKIGFDFSGGYGLVLKDKTYLLFLGALTLFQICSLLMWFLLGVYTKQNFNMPENQYGFLPTTNALLVVLFQIAVTRVTRKYSSEPVMALGALVYALGVGSIALGNTFWNFWLSFVVITLGELILMPTTSTYVANRAPTNVRGRYMSLYMLTGSVGAGLGPVLGGWLNDTLGPVSIWYGGGLVGLLGAVGFAWLARQTKVAEPAGGESSSGSTEIRIS